MALLAVEVVEVAVVAAAAEEKPELVSAAAALDSACFVGREAIVVA